MAFFVLLEPAASADGRPSLEEAVRRLAARHGAQVVPGARGRSVLELRPPAAEAGALRRGLEALEGVRLLGPGEAPSVAPSPPAPRPLRTGPARFGAGALGCIAGPCSVESAEQYLPLAERLREAGACALRGGAWKPRTSPYAFDGLGEEALEILAEAHRRTGLPVVAEVLDPRSIPALAGRVQILQIGSRNMANAVLLREAAGSGLPVLLKRGMSATLGEFLQAAETLALGGCEGILLCERGLRHFDPAVRNLLDLSAVPALQQRTGLPVVVDPSHGTGRRELVPAMMAAAAAAGADGLLVEVHPAPEASWSDARQALDPEAFASALGTVEAVLRATSRRLARPGGTGEGAGAEAGA